MKYDLKATFNEDEDNDPYEVFNLTWNELAKELEDLRLYSHAVGIKDVEITEA